MASIDELVTVIGAARSSIGDASVGYDDGPGVTGLGMTDHAAEAWAEHGPGWG